MAKTIEVFTAGCSLCQEAIELVHRAAASGSTIHVRDLRDPTSAARAKALGVQRVPAIAVDDQLLGCCKGGGVDEDEVRAATA